VDTARLRRAPEAAVGCGCARTPGATTGRPQAHELDPAGFAAGNATVATP